MFEIQQNCDNIKEIFLQQEANDCANDCLFITKNANPKDTKVIKITLKIRDRYIFLLATVIYYLNINCSFSYRSTF